MKRLLVAAVLALGLTGVASAQEAVIPVGTALMTMGKGLIGVEVGYYSLWSNANYPAKSQITTGHAPVAAYVQQSATFRNNAVARFPQFMKPESTSTIQAFQMSKAAVETKSPSAHYVFNIWPGSDSDFSTAARTVDPVDLYAAHKASGYTAADFAKYGGEPIYSATIAEAKQELFLRLGKVQGLATGGQLPASPAGFIVPAVDGTANLPAWATGYPTRKGVQFGKFFNGILVAWAWGSSSGSAQYLWEIPNSCDAGWEHLASGMCQKVAASTIPEPWSLATRGYALDGEFYFEEHNPELYIADYFLSVQKGISKFAMNIGLCYTADTPDQCTARAYKMLPTAMWTYNTSSSSACIPLTNANPVCISLVRAPAQKLHCAVGYGRSIATVNGVYDCQLLDPDAVVSIAGWGCRIERHADGRFFVSDADEDCAYLSTTASTSTGAFEIAWGASVSTFRSMPEEQDGNGIVLKRPRIHIEYKIPYSAEQVTTAYLDVDTETNRVVAFIVSTAVEPPPRIKGIVGQVNGMEKGLRGGTNIGGVTNNPGFGCTTQCPSNAPTVPGKPGTVPTDSNGNPVTPSAPGETVPGEDGSSPGTGEPGSTPDGTPDAFKKIIGSSTLPVSSSCPANIFSLDFGTVAGYPMKISDGGVFCSVMVSYGALLRKLSIALAAVGALFIVISA